jgi:IS5 family transposase
MRQTKKGKKWFFGLKAHIGVDARTGLTHSLSTTVINVHDITETEKLLHCEENFIFADSGYRGTQKREELKSIKTDWLIAKMPSKVRTLKKYPRKNKQPIQTEYIKANIQAKV